MPQAFTLLVTPQIQWIIILLAIDVVLGITASLAKKNLRLGKIANFMVKPVLGYVFGFVVLVSAIAKFPSLAIVVTIAYFLIILALLGSILNNLGKMGIPMPSWLKKE